jgi:hypothetical protein
VGFDSGRWKVLDPGGRLMPYLGRPSLYLERGIALVQDTSVADGTIEFDVALHGNAGFAGVVFRGQSPDDYELIYLRTHRSRQWDALQYTPMFSGQEAWQLYTGEGYTGVAELPANRWVHVRVVVQGYSARVYVDGASEPQLIVTDLKRPWARGYIGLWGRSGAANFSDVKFSDATGTAPNRPPAATAPGIIGHWSLSPTFDAATVSRERLPDAAIANSGDWKAVTSEASGIVNIAQHRRKIAVPRTPQDLPRDVVFARTTLISQIAQRVRLSFGYSDDVTIFLNGRALFSGNASYLERDGSYLGTLTFDDDSVFLDLAAGQNQLVFAVEDVFGVWGLAARIDPSAGVTLQR